MIYTQKIQDAIHFSIQVHEEPVKQVRKGKEVPYVTHPLAVGLILTRAGAEEDVIVAGLLHDTIEDCEPYGTVTKELLTEKFGAKAASLVDAVSEKDKSLGWHERKEHALKEIKEFSHDALMVKSADVISNNTELIADYERDGEATFDRFNAPKTETIPHTLEVIDVIQKAWPENPLARDLEAVVERLQLIKDV